MYVIGIVGRAYFNKDGQKIIQTHEATRRFFSNEKEVICITLLPDNDDNYIDIVPGNDSVNESKIDYILDKCDAFIVPGGTYFYHFDEYVINYAIKKDKPLLAICLGFQALCSMFASERIKFDMTTKFKDDSHVGKSDEYIHKVLVKDNTLLKDILIDDVVPVNSIHHDIVDFDIDILKINAISKDGIIEGVEYPNKKFIVGLQWHPEYLNDKYSNRIRDSFIKAIK